MARGRIFEVTLPDGQVVTRESLGRVYTHASIALEPERTRPVRYGAPEEGEETIPAHWIVRGFAGSYELAVKAMNTYPGQPYTERRVVECVEVEKATKGAGHRGRGPRADKSGAPGDRSQEAQPSSGLMTDRTARIVAEKKAAGEELDERAAALEAERAANNGFADSQLELVDVTPWDLERRVREGETISVDVAKGEYSNGYVYSHGSEAPGVASPIAGPVHLVYSPGPNGMVFVIASDLVALADPEPTPDPAPIVAPKPEGGNATMPRKITDRNLAVGTKLVAGYKGKTYHAEVIQFDGGEIGYSVLEHDLAPAYKSLSAAGSAIFGIDKAGKARTCNGWDFWKLDEPVAHFATLEAANKHYEKERIVFTTLQAANDYWAAAQVARTTSATKPARARKAKATSTEPPTPDDAVYGGEGIGCAYCAHVSPDATKAAEHMEEAHPTGEPLPVVAYDQEAVAV